MNWYVLYVSNITKGRRKWILQFKITEVYCWIWIVFTWMNKLTCKAWAKKSAMTIWFRIWSDLLSSLEDPGKIPPPLPFPTFNLNNRAVYRHYCHCNFILLLFFRCYFSYFHMRHWLLFHKVHHLDAQTDTMTFMSKCAEQELRLRIWHIVRFLLASFM